MTTDQKRKQKKQKKDKKNPDKLPPKMGGFGGGGAFTYTRIPSSW